MFYLYAHFIASQHSSNRFDTRYTTKFKTEFLIIPTCIISIHNIYISTNKQSAMISLTGARLTRREKAFLKKSTKPINVEGLFAFPFWDSEIYDIRKSFVTKYR